MRSFSVLAALAATGWAHGQTHVPPSLEVSPAYRIFIPGAAPTWRLALSDGKWIAGAIGDIATPRHVWRQMIDGPVEWIGVQAFGHPSLGNVTVNSHGDVAGTDDAGLPYLFTTGSGLQSLSLPHPFYPVKINEQCLIGGTAIHPDHYAVVARWTSANGLTMDERTPGHSVADMNQRGDLITNSGGNGSLFCPANGDPPYYLQVDPHWFSGGTAVSDSGWAVGNIYLGGGAWQFNLTTIPGRMWLEPLPGGQVQPHAMGINRNGWVVGYCYNDPVHGNQALIWYGPGPATPLTSRLSPEFAGWKVTSSTEISESGLIACGVKSPTGQNYTAVLVPSLRKR